MNDALVDQARRAGSDIRAGALRGAALLDMITALPFRERDAWVDEALGFAAPPDDVALPPGAVPYVPCGVDAIVHTVVDARIGSDDVFVDLGAGLGRVAVLVHLLTGARAVGVELQPHLVEGACATAAALSLPNVAFHLGDAAVVDVPDGTVFFIYASFSQPVLTRVLARLKQRAARGPITLCAVGFDVLDQAWLRACPSSSAELALYRSTSSSP